MSPKLKYLITEWCGKQYTVVGTGNDQVLGGREK